MPPIALNLTLESLAFLMTPDPANPVEHMRPLTALNRDLTESMGLLTALDLTNANVVLNLSESMAMPAQDPSLWPVKVGHLVQVTNEEDDKILAPQLGPNYCIRTTDWRHVTVGDDEAVSTLPELCVSCYLRVWVCEGACMCRCRHVCERVGEQSVNCSVKHKKKYHHRKWTHH